MTAPLLVFPPTNLTPIAQGDLPSYASVNSLTKRSIDMIGALLGLILTGRVAIPMAIAMFLREISPLLFSQTRCGLQGRRFRIWKFRSMKVNAEQIKHPIHNQAQGLIFKNENDPRITTLGQFLRRTSLDEFPQFWNVLKGEMSLVGTRPPTEDEVARYKPHHWRRLAVKLDITREWQVRGRSTIQDFKTIVQLDLDYQRKWSVVYDLKLILQTFGAVLTQKGAY